MAHPCSKTFTISVGACVSPGLTGIGWVIQTGGPNNPPTNGSASGSSGNIQITGGSGLDVSSISALGTICLNQTANLQITGTVTYTVGVHGNEGFALTANGNNIVAAVIPGGVPPTNPYNGSTTIALPAGGSTVEIKLAQGGSGNAAASFTLAFV